MYFIFLFGISVEKGKENNSWWKRFSFWRKRKYRLLLRVKLALYFAQRLLLFFFHCVSPQSRQNALIYIEKLCACQAGDDPLCPRQVVHRLTPWCLSVHAQAWGNYVELDKEKSENQSEPEQSFNYPLTQHTDLFTVYFSCWVLKNATFFLKHMFIIFAMDRYKKGM